MNYDSKKIYTRADLRQLAMTDPDIYQFLTPHLEGEGHKTYEQVLLQIIFMQKAVLEEVQKQYFKKDSVLDTTGMVQL